MKVIFDNMGILIAGVVLFFVFSGVVGVEKERKEGGS